MNFHEIAQISNVYKNGTLKKYNWREMDELLLPYDFYGRDM